MNTGLAGTGLIADDLYLMAHHEVTGKPFVQPRPLGIGLAAALAAELMLTGSVSLTAEGAQDWTGVSSPRPAARIGETGPATAW